MLGFITRYGSSKGMVAVPDLSGQTVDQALELIRTNGLKFKQSTLRITSNVAFDKKVYTQDLAPGTLVDYESEISFFYDSYYGTTANVTYGPVERYNSIPSSSCSGTTLVKTTTYLNRKKVFFEGQDQGFYEEVAATSESSSEVNSASCGYVPPAKTCPAGCGDFGAYSACDQTPRTNTGLRYRERTCVRADCSTYIDREVSTCCIPGCSSTTSTSSNISTTTTTCVAVDCTTTVTSKSTCRVESSTVCGACRTRSPFNKTCTKTTLNADCTSTRETFTSTVGCSPPKSAI
jgi:hypothetical protein